MRYGSLILLALALASPLAAQRPVEAKDLLRIRDVSDPQLSPDGAWVAYTVSTSDTVADKGDADVWMSSWDGKRSVRLTNSKAKESSPRWSPDGRYLAFLSSREDSREVEQVWLLDRTGGEARAGHRSPRRRLRLRLVTRRNPAGADRLRPRRPSSSPRGRTPRRSTPRPIVIDRYRFKYDGVGYIGTERDHLYLLTLADRKATLLTPGKYDEAAPSWSPDGRSIAFLSRRRPEYDRTDNWDVYVVAAQPGSEPRQLTTYEGADGDPEWGSRAVGWSPDGKLIAYVQGGKPELLYYGGHKLAVVPVDGGPARVLTASLDRNILSPVFSRDGASVLFLLEDDRVTHLARVPTAGGSVERVVEGRRTLEDLSLGRDGRIAVTSSTPDRPTEVFAVEGRELRKVSAQNDAWLAQVRLAPLEEITFKSRDGTSINGFVLKPLGYRAGTRYPTLLRIHGGPVWQFFNDFANLDWQVFAAQGYVVVGVNPRGSSGRGEKFSTAIFADWGEKDGDDVLAAVDHARRGRHRRSRAAGRRRVELRRDPHQPGDRARPAVQGGDQRCGAGERAPGLRHRHVRAGVRAGAGEAVGQPGHVAAGVAALPARGPHRDADALPLRPGGLERPPDQLGADVPGPQEPRPGDGARHLPGRVPWDRATLVRAGPDGAVSCVVRKVPRRLAPRRRAPGAAREDGA